MLQTHEKFLQNFDFFLEHNNYAPSYEAREKLHGLCKKALDAPSESIFESIVHFSKYCRDELLSFEDQQPIETSHYHKARQQAESNLVENTIEMAHFKTTHAFILALGMKINAEQGMLSPAETPDLIKAATIALNLPQKSPSLK